MAETIFLIIISVLVVRFVVYPITKIFIEVIEQNFNDDDDLW